MKVLVTGTNSGLGKWLSKQFPYCDKFTRDTRISDLQDEYDLIIDSLFGVGLNRPISSELFFFIKKINNTNTSIVSIDMPTGVHTDTGKIDGIAIKANTTLTFHRLKPGLLLLPGKEYAGDIKILDIQLANLDKETK